MDEYQSSVDEIEASFGKRIPRNVVAEYRQVAPIKLFQVACIDVRCEDLPFLTNPIAQPAGDMAPTGAHLQTRPAMHHAEVGDDALGAGIKDSFDCSKTRRGVVARVVEDVRGASLCRASRLDQGRQSGS
jgi:hypothetical protein